MESTSFWIFHGTSQFKSKQNIGKWMLFYPNDEIDNKWEKIITLYNEDKLKGIHTMKMSTSKPNPRSSDSNKKVIIAYSSGCEQDIMDTGKKLMEQMQYETDMYYKLDSQSSDGSFATGQKKNHTYRINYVSRQADPVREPLQTVENLPKNIEENLIVSSQTNYVEFIFNALKPKEQWKIFPYCMNKTCYIDIETTGLSKINDSITTAVVHSSSGTYTFINGVNLDKLPETINKFKCLVTFNGKCFDIPFIESKLNIKITIPHLDLRYILLDTLNMKGGLKSCEIQLKMPPREIEEVNGCIAPTLWAEYKNDGNVASLQKLLAYNFEDSVRLEWIMKEILNRTTNNSEPHTIFPKNPFKT